uniref:Uncharacterized protein n=1 Tax=Rhizophora mucronata TaxID=61149 RepID=A0A2P2N221_RHIMU
MAFFISGAISSLVTSANIAGSSVSCSCQLTFLVKP